VPGGSLFSGKVREDLTNVQFPILNSHPKGEAALEGLGEPACKTSDEN
jgi:hypothetical protein